MDLAREELATLRKGLRQLLLDYGISSNPGVSNYWLVQQIRELIVQKIKNCGTLTEAQRKGSFHF